MLPRRRWRSKESGKGETLMEDGAVSALGKAGTAARRHFAHEHKPNGWPTQEEIRGVDSVSPDAMNPDPKTAARQEQKRRAAQKQSRIFQERQRQSKNTVRGLRGVDRDQKQLRTAANTVRQEKQAQQAAQRTQTILRHARQTAREGVETAQKAATVLHSAIRHLLAALQSLAAALIAGGWIAVFIVLLICLIALVAGSAYGIFFAAETPDENAISVTQLFGGGTAGWFCAGKWGCHDARYGYSFRGWRSAMAVTDCGYDYFAARLSYRSYHRRNQLP